MLTVALTGNVAAGKTTVSELWRAAGVPVISADTLARQVVEPEGEALAELAREFGPGVLRPDGTLDRDALRAVVFADEARRVRLEAILHPRIEARRVRWMQARERESAQLVVAEIPLLFEVGREGDYDVTVLVDAPEDVRLRRIVRDRGLSEAEARAIMRAQMDPVEKRRRAHRVLNNGGDLKALRRDAADLLADLRAEAGAAW